MGIMKPLKKKRNKEHLSYFDFFFILNCFFTMQIKNFNIKKKNLYLILLYHFLLKKNYF